MRYSDKSVLVFRHSRVRRREQGCAHLSELDSAGDEFLYKSIKGQPGSYSEKEMVWRCTLLSSDIAKLNVVKL